MTQGDMKIRVRRDTSRPDRVLWSEFVGAASSMVADAQGRSGALDSGICPISSVVAATGPALTIETRPGDNAALLVALDWVRPGDVIVAANFGATAAAIYGGHYAAMAKARGAVAIVSDGPGRDLHEIAELDLPCFSRGLCPNGPFKFGPGSIGWPIAIGGVRIETGDLVVTDADGIVIVPQSRLKETAARLREIKKHEGEISRLIAEDDSDHVLKNVLSAIKTEVF